MKRVNQQTSDTKPRTSERPTATTLKVKTKIKASGPELQHNQSAARPRRER